MAYRAHNVFDVVNWIAYTCVFCCALVGEVDFSVFVHCHVFEQRVAADGVENVWLRLFVQVDDFGIASAFKVEDAFVVPSMFVVADEFALGVGGECGLSGS